MSVLRRVIRIATYIKRERWQVNRDTNARRRFNRVTEGFPFCANIFPSLWTILLRNETGGLFSMPRRMAYEWDVNFILALTTFVPRFRALPESTLLPTASMPLRRRKCSSPPRRGLAPGESLNRYLVPTHNTQPALWAWVGSEVTQESDVSTEHCLMTCGMSARNVYPFCANKYAASQIPNTAAKEEIALDEEVEEIIIVSDDGIKCSKKGCKGNPNCLNYLGQDKWEDEGMYSHAPPLSSLINQFAQEKQCENF